MNLGVLQTVELETNFASAMVKLLYAFVWQEWVLTNNPAVFEPETNAMGNAAITTVNSFANSLNNWPIYDQDLQVH